MKNLYTIGQLAKLAGISTKTLRVYERKGLLMPARNMDNSYRMYGEDAVRTLEKIQLMKCLDFSLDQIAEFLTLYENVRREKMLSEQKRLLEKKRAGLNTVIAHVDRAIKECQGETTDINSFLKELGNIVKNQKADERAGRLQLHANEPCGWSRFAFDVANPTKDMQVLDAGAGWGNLWRYNQERLPENLKVTCVDKHNTHMDTFNEYIQEQKASGQFADSEISFVWDDLETMPIVGPYDLIFFNHVVYYIENRDALYRKFAHALSEKGTLICTWGGVLFYEKLQPLLREFFEDSSELDQEYERHRIRTTNTGAELKTIFPIVEKHTYVITLRFDTAEQFLEYIQQVCKPVREVLEIQRTEFLTFLEGLEHLKNEQGQFEFQRDTYLYACKKEM